MTTEANPSTTNPAQSAITAPADTPMAPTPPSTPTPTPAPTEGAPTATAPSLGETGAKVDSLKVDLGGSGDGKTFTYSKTGDVRLDTALGFIGNLGIGADDVAVQAARDGDFGLLKAKLASLGDKAKGWEQFVSLAEASHADNKAATEAATAKIVEAVHSAVGGKDSWEPIQAWAKANADDSERAQINAMFAAGPVAATAAAKYLQELYQRAAGTIVQPARATAAHVSASPASSSGGALNPAEYQKAVAELAARVGSTRINDHPEYKQLQQRRLAFRG